MNDSGKILRVEVKVEKNFQETRKEKEEKTAVDPQLIIEGMKILNEYLDDSFIFFQEQIGPGVKIIDFHYEIVKTDLTRAFEMILLGKIQGLEKSMRLAAKVYFDEKKQKIKRDFEF